MVVRGGLDGVSLWVEDFRIDVNVFLWVGDLVGDVYVGEEWY